MSISPEIDQRAVDLKRYKRHKRNVKDVERKTRKEDEEVIDQDSGKEAERKSPKEDGEIIDKSSGRKAERKTRKENDEVIDKHGGRGAERKRPKEEEIIDKNNGRGAERKRRKEDEEVIDKHNGRGADQEQQSKWNEDESEEKERVHVPSNRRRREPSSNSEEDVANEIQRHVNRVKSVVTQTAGSRNERRDEKSGRGRSRERDGEERNDTSDRPERELRTTRGDTGYDRTRRRRDDESQRDRERSRRHIRDASPDPREKTEATSGDPAKEEVDYLAAKRAKIGDESITTRTGGAYIPPARLRAMQAQITDKASMQYQRIAWEMLKKSINGHINKVNVSNLIMIVRELFQENIVRGRGLLSRSVMLAQAASPTFTHVYAALVAVINTKFPEIGALILKRLSLQFKRGFKRNDKALCLSSTRFIAHLVNQQVAHEILALEILTLLLESPTDDSVEVSIGFLKECGRKLTDVSPKGINATFERLRIVLHEAQIDKRVQYMIEVMFAVRKDGFKDHPAVLEALDVVEEEDQCTHMVALDDAVDAEEGLNVFKMDDAYEQNEELYKGIRRGILGEDSSDEDGGEDGDSDGSDSEEEDEETAAAEEAKKTLIIDQTETNLSSFRVTVYLTIQSSLDFEECAHKLLKMNMKPGQEVELNNMILDCCAQQRTYEKFYGLLGQRFCMIDRKYITPYQKMFKEQYDTIHRLETNKLRNIAKFFGHLLWTDAISWEVLHTVRLTEEDTTSSSRIFIKILFQELSEFMGLHKLNNRLKDPTLQVFFDGLFPRDQPKNTRFAINFFTSVGLGGLTDELREHLKSAPRPDVVVAEEEESSDSSGSDSSSSSDSSSDSSDDTSSDSSEDEKSAPRRPPRHAAAPPPPPQPRSHGKRGDTAASKDDGPSTAQMKLLAMAYGEDVDVGNKKSSEKKEKKEKVPEKREKVPEKREKVLEKREKVPEKQEKVPEKREKVPEKREKVREKKEKDSDTKRDKSEERHHHRSKKSRRD